MIVVDNAPSSDATQRVSKNSLRFGMCATSPWLNAARNRAVREATGDIVAFTTMMPWSNQSGWMGFGELRGFARDVCDRLTLPVELETEAQELFEEHCSFCRGFRRRIFDGQCDNPFAVGPVGAGANMAIRRELPTLVGQFDERLDAGTPARSGGDHEIFARFLCADLASSRSVGSQLAPPPAHARRGLDTVFATASASTPCGPAGCSRTRARRSSSGMELARHEPLPALLQGGAPRRDRIARISGGRNSRFLHGPRALLAARRARTP